MHQPSPTRPSPRKERLRSIALVGTYVPRRCGIATFTADLHRALRAAARPSRVGVVAMDDDDRRYDYPSEVEFEIRQDVLEDYRLAADYLNASHADVVSIQHEYGIFGGADGGHLLELLDRLRMPVVTTLHTVLRTPSPGQREVTLGLAERSDRLVVLSDTAARFLRDVYGVDPEKIVKIPHGIPDLPFIDPNFHKDRFGVEGKKVLLTFGLLSPNKGIETAIRAMKRIVEEHPDTVYIVLGETHPHVKRASGEAYREELKKLARDLGVEDNVVFDDRYVDLAELSDYLGAADVYVTPYLNEEQVVSGTLSYAMGAGKAVVSTPYWHAVEMLANGRGKLVGFRDPEGLAEAVIQLLSNERERHEIRKRAYLHLRDSVWPRVGERYLELFDEVRRERTVHPRVVHPLPRHRPLTPLPKVDLRHLFRLSDDTGILQHAVHQVPDRTHGYCTDDNARALLVALAARRHDPTGRVDELALRYLGFLHHAFDPERGVFRNFLAYDRRWTEAEGSPDSHGRAVWALGVTAARSSSLGMRRVAQDLLHRALPRLERIGDLRPLAFGLLGLLAHREMLQGDTVARRTCERLAERLWRAFRDADDPDWPWPEDVLSYANARLPHALILAGKGLERPALIEAGTRSLSWLLELQTEGERFSPIGNLGWYPRGGTRARFDQQPIEADALVAACASAFEVTGDPTWLEGCELGFGWFLGHNDLGHSLYDPATGGCRDGLHANRANENQGAESTLAWLSTLLGMHALRAQGVQLVRDDVPLEAAR